MTATRSNPISRNPLGREAMLAARLARTLDGATRSLPPGVEERLRVAREQAVAKARTEPEGVFVGVAAGATSLGWLAGGWWSRMALLVPIVALAVGLFAIEQRHRDAQIATAVEIDSALLVDDAPLDAYRDAGFVEFLKLPN